jgi:hypothetical protein
LTEKRIAHESKHGVHGSHGEHVGSSPGRAGPVGVVMKRSHLFGVEPDAVVTDGSAYLMTVTMT